MTSTERVLPNVAKFERDLVGLVFQDPSIFQTLASVASWDDFFEPNNRTAWRAFTEMKFKGVSIDPKLAFAYIKQHFSPDEFGGEQGLLDYFVERMNFSVGKNDAEDYAKAVKQTKIARELIEAARIIENRAYQVTFDASEELTEAQQCIAKIGMGATASAVRSQWEAANEYLLELDDRVRAYKEGRDPGRCLPTGFGALDSIIGGLFKSELTIVAARPSVGKTIFGGSIARNLAQKGHPGFFASLEQRDTAIIGRMLSSLTGVPSGALRSGDLADWHSARIGTCADTLLAMKIWWDHRPRQTIGQITATARSLKAKHGIKWVCVDYLTLVEPDQKNRQRNRTAEVGEVSRGLKAMARELEIPVVCLAQLNRDSEKRADPKPKVSDLRDSGEIEQDADVILLLHKPDPPDSFRPIDKLQIIIGKCREGSLGEVEMEHHKQYFDFRSPGEVIESG